jgi:hypothetical protein
MNRLLLSALLVTALVGSSVLPAADSKPAAGSPAARPALVGEYAGKWKGRDDAGGELRIKLKQDAAGWIAETVFTLQGNEVPTKTKALAVDGSKLELTIAWEAEGTAAQTKLVGALNGNVMEGTYESTISESSASGTWRVTRA